MGVESMTTDYSLAQAKAETCIKISMPKHDVHVVLYSCVGWRALTEVTEGRPFYPCSGQYDDWVEDYDTRRRRHGGNSVTIPTRLLLT